MREKKNKRTKEMCTVFPESAVSLLQNGAKKASHYLTGPNNSLAGQFLQCGYSQSR